MTAIPDAATATADRALIFQAYRYGFPAFEQARLIYNFSYSAQTPHKTPVNTFLHRRYLVRPGDQIVTTPNNDTLYSSAVLDLSAGPLKLSVPRFGGRYYSIAFLDAYTNVFAYIGTRLNHGNAGTYLIAGPKSHYSRNNDHCIIAPSNHVIALVRIRIRGEKDYDEVHQLQDGLKLETPLQVSNSQPLPRPEPDSGESFVQVVNQVLRNNPPPPSDKPLLKRLAAVGIGPDAPPLTIAQSALWNEYLPKAKADLIRRSQDLGKPHNGWTYMPDDVGDFGADYLTRAKIAVMGLWANTAIEQTYAVANDDEIGKPLSSKRAYKLHFPAGEPKTHGFWSISIYAVDKNGHYFLSDNPLHRFSISSDATDVKRNVDGSLDIIIQQQAPTGPKQDNWLPISAEHFALVLRNYLPYRSRVNRGTYPPIKRLDPIEP